MTLDQFRSVADRALEPVVAGAEALGLSPNTVTVIAFGFALVAAGAFASASPGTPGWYVVGGLAVFLNGSLDLLDGQLARQQGVESESGDFLDHALDRYADVAIVGGLAAGIGRFDLGLVAVTGVLLTSYMGTQVQAVGLDRTYGGLLGRADRIAIVGVVTILAPVAPDPIAGLPLVGWLLAFLGVVGHVTAIQRFWGAWSDLE